MLVLNLLKEESTLNNLDFIATKSFIEGEDVVVLMQIAFEGSHRYIPDSAATLEVTLQKSDNNTLTKVPTNPFADDRSIVQFTFTAAETADLISQNLLLKITEPSGISYALKKAGLQKTKLTSGCFDG